LEQNLAAADSIVATRPGNRGAILNHEKEAKQRLGPNSTQVSIGRPLSSLISVHVEEGRRVDGGL
jgi:hypothetical protein